MKSLLLTLGHNSSAALIENGTLQWAYETERVTRVKSDSWMPVAVLEMTGVLKSGVDMVYATHWAPSGQLKDMGPKYWHPHLFDGVPIRTLNPDRTHHDAHMAAAVCYAGPKFPYGRGTYGLVIDGFGILGEHFSIYDLSTGVPKLLRRVHGYNTSLGLWYQYATAFMGMKMHEDEYKLLGYEVYVPESEADQLDAAAKKAAEEWVEQMSKSIYGSRYDPLYDVTALANIKDEVFRHLNAVCAKHNITNSAEFRSRAIIAYYVQAVLENVVMTFVRDLSPIHLLCSGGVFYNVKLNKRLVDLVPGKLCFYPLAGDQGNALGLYAMDHPKFEMPMALNWGRRVLRSMGDVEGMHVVDELEARDLVQKYLDMYGFVNLVRGGMEFGPRAMCNTSTLAMPTKQIVDRINRANDRNTVMPMAPVMVREMYDDLFRHSDKLWRSEHHMITAMEYAEDPPEDWLGVAHQYRRPYHHFTGRPQVTLPTDWFMNDLIHSLGHPLINTSFNFHGWPIAFDMPSIIDNHRAQRTRDNAFHTVVIRNV